MSVEVKAVQSSSHYQSGKYGEDGLAPYNVIQNHPRFGGWLSALAHWEHAWLEFHFAEPSVLKHLVIENGYVDPAKDGVRDNYYFHLRARDIRISTADEFCLHTLQDTPNAQSISLNFEHPATFVRLEILNVYADAPDESIQVHDVVGLRHVAWFDC